MILSIKIVDTANREIAMPIESSSSGQIAYKYANCLNCGSGNSYLEGRANCFCPRCGQKLIWFVHEKTDNKMKTKKYKIVFRIIVSIGIKSKIIKAVNMFDAMSTFYLYTMHVYRTDVLKAYEVVDIHKI